MSAGVASHSLYCSKSAPILFDLLIIPANAPDVNFVVAPFNRLHTFFSFVLTSDPICAIIRIVDVEIVVNLRHHVK